MFSLFQPSLGKESSRLEIVWTLPNWNGGSLLLGSIHQMGSLLLNTAFSTTGCKVFQGKIFGFPEIFIGWGVDSEEKRETHAHNLMKSLWLCV